MMPPRCVLLFFFSFPPHLSFSPSNLTGLDLKDWKLDHHEKAAKLRDNKSAIRRIWQFGKSNSSGASASATAPEDAEALQFPRSPRSDNEHHVIQDLTEEAPFMETRGEEEEEEEDGERMNPGEVAASPDSKADAAPMTAWSARSKEDIAATRIQAACRGHLVHIRRGGGGKFVVWNFHSSCHLQTSLSLSLLAGEERATGERDG